MTFPFRVLVAEAGFDVRGCGSGQNVRAVAVRAAGYLHRPAANAQADDESGIRGERLMIGLSASHGLYGPGVPRLVNLLRKKERTDGAVVAGVPAGKSAVDSEVSMRPARANPVPLRLAKLPGSSSLR